MEEVSTGKMVKNFVIKFILWFLLIDVVLGGIILVANASNIANVDPDDMEEAGDAIKGAMNWIIIVNVVATVGAPLLATRSTKKKYKITNENKKSLFKGMVIVMVVVAIIMAILHLSIKKLLINAVAESTDDLDMSEIKEALKDIEEYVEEEDLPKDVEDALEVIDSFYGGLNIYGMDWIILVVMIGVEYIIIVRKDQEVA